MKRTAILIMRTSLIAGVVFLPFKVMAADLAVGGQGHCPICAMHGNSKMGNDNFVTEYKGKIYKFRSIEMQKAFLEDPEKYTQGLDNRLKEIEAKNISEKKVGK